MEGLFTIIGVLLAAGCVFVISKIIIIGGKTLIYRPSDQEDLGDGPHIAKDEEIFNAEEKREIFSTIIRHLFIWR